MTGKTEGGSNPPGAAEPELDPAQMRLFNVAFRTGRVRLKQRGVWGERIERVELVFQRFITGIGNPALELLVPQIARELVFMSFPPPLQVRMSKKKCQEKLDKILDFGRGLLDEIVQMQPSVKEALGFDPHDWTSFLDLRYELIELIERAENSSPSETLPDDIRGAPKAEGAARLTLRLAEYFMALTQTVPKRVIKYNEPSGAFYELVHDVFQALEITDSADNRAKEAIAAFKSQPPPNEQSGDAIRVEAHLVLTASRPRKGRPKYMEKNPAKSTD
jgi:hypothetical protein